MATNTKYSPEPNIPANPVPELHNPISYELNDLQYPSIVASPNPYIHPQMVAPSNATKNAHFSSISVLNHHEIITIPCPNYHKSDH